MPSRVCRRYASTYLAGTNTRRVRRALQALFGGAVGKDVVSRVWRKVKAELNRHAIPDGSDGLLQSLPAIHDQQIGATQAAIDKIIENEGS